MKQILTVTLAVAMLFAACQKKKGQSPNVVYDTVTVVTTTDDLNAVVENAGCRRPFPTLSWKSATTAPTTSWGTAWTATWSQSR